MSDKPDMKLVQRIKNLLSLAGHNDNVEEAAAASAKAEKMMADHGITLQQILFQSDDQTRTGMDHRKAHAYVNKVGPGYKGHHRHVQQFAQWMAVAVGDLFGCHSALSVLVLNNGAASFGCVEFFGLTHDVERAQWTFTYLMEAIRRAGEKYRNEALIPRGVTGANQKLFSTSFREGFSTMICQRVGELLAARTPEPPPKPKAKRGRAEPDASDEQHGLVLYQARKESIEDVFGHFEYGEAGERVRSRSAWDAGSDAARDVPLNTPIQAETQARVRGDGSRK